MSWNARNSYRKLRNDEWFDDIGETNGYMKEKDQRCRSKVQIRRKMKIKIPSLRKMLMRKKEKVVEVTWSKFMKRCKEIQSNFGEIFGGNYLVLQVAPPSLKYIEKAHQNLHQFSSKSCLPRIS